MRDSDFHDPFEIMQRGFLPSSRIRDAARANAAEFWSASGATPAPRRRSPPHSGYARPTANSTRCARTRNGPPAASNG